MWTIYCYDKCSTCRKALAWLEERKIPFKLKAIRETPPSVHELEVGLKSARAKERDWNSLANTSGLDWRAGGWREKMAGMSDEERLAAFAGNGSLIRRPFAIHTDGRALSGFREKEWEATFSE